MGTIVYGSQAVINYPITSDESTDNTSSVAISVDDRESHKWQLTAIVSTGTALAGVLTVYIQSVGTSEYQVVDGTIDMTAPSPQLIEAKFSSIKAVPTTPLTAGCKYTLYLDLIE